ncbi:MAG: T9SS type A sorting domain-containing protein [Saprospiraceae bacterium]|nr:T9SS type A sorting domain-containing protein [Saprospiraceae bacterium]
MMEHYLSLRVIFQRTLEDNATCTDCGMTTTGPINVAEITVCPTENTTYIVLVTDTNGCRNSQEVTIIVNPLPTPSITGDNIICNGESTTLTATGGSTYVWSNGATTATITVNPSTTTTYNVTITDNNGCQASTSITITVNPIPTPTIVGNGIICKGSSTTLFAIGGSTYVWSNGTTTATNTVNPSVTTTYSVTTTDVNGCQGSTSMTVTVNPLPTPSITGDNVICNGESTTLTAAGGSTYIWSNGATTATNTVNPSVTTTYSVTTTDVNGCQGSTSMTVTVNPLPTPSITGDNVICNGESTTLTAAGGSTYVWSNGATTATNTVNPSVTTTYSVTTTDVNGCQGSTSIMVVVNPLPIAIITGENKVCEGNSLVLTASGGVIFIWSNGSTNSVINVQPVINTTYSVTVTNLEGCIDTTSINVMIKPKPTIIISGPDNLCKGEETFIVVNGHSNNNCPDVCNVETPKVLAYWDLEACNSYMHLGTHLDYSEFIAIVDYENCTRVTASNVNRLPGNKHSCTPGFDGKVGMCISTQNSCIPSKLDYNQSLRFEVTIQPGNTGQITGLQFYEQSPTNYKFIDGAGALNNFATKYLLRVSKNGSIIYYQDEILTSRTWNLQSFNFDGNPLFKNNTAAKYLFELIPYCTINNGGLESVWDIDDIKVIGGCCTSTTPEVMTYLWSTGATTPSITVKPIKTTTYKVTVTDCCGCSNVEEYVVNVADLKVDLGIDKIINLGESITLKPTITGASECDDQNPSANVLKYLWINGETTPSITVTPNVSSFYRVTVTDCNECVDTESITIHIRMFASIVTYPNPARNLINIVSEADLDPNSKVRLFHSNGLSVAIDINDISFENARNILINLPSALVNGVYILELESGTQIVRQKLVVQNE